MDFLMGRYHIKTKSRNIMIIIFYHFVDLSATNAYILYKRFLVEKASDSSHVIGEQLKLAEFRSQIAAGLLSIKEKRSVGRQKPSFLATQGKRAIHQVQDIRFDGENHFPIWLDRKGKKRCKHCKKSDTQMICSKCKLHLCGKATQNCFWDYHHQN